ncbi:MAG: DUF1816 domain-containing protein [Scytonema hyalinum WJT4-NPBG1]|nr:DUF1816 domain-containing protein [Scytonema hyalinum WJT4-NPBG1]
MQDKCIDRSGKIIKTIPRCISYFRLLETCEIITYRGYIEDLDSEKVQGIVVVIKHCYLEVLTIFQYLIRKRIKYILDKINKNI